MSTTTATDPQTFTCDACGADTPSAHGAKLGHREQPVCLGCESRYIAGDVWAADAAWQMLHDAAYRALDGGYLSPEDAAAAVAAAVQRVRVRPQRTRADLLQAERSNARRRDALRAEHGGSDHAAA